MTTTQCIDSAFLERAMNEQLKHAAAYALDGTGSDDTNDYLIAALELAADLVHMWRDDNVEAFRALLEDPAPDNDELRGIEMYACDGVCPLLQEWFEE